MKTVSSKLTILAILLLLPFTMGAFKARVTGSAADGSSYTDYCADANCILCLRSNEPPNYLIDLSGEDTIITNTMDTNPNINTPISLSNKTFRICAASSSNRFRNHRMTPLACRRYAQEPCLLKRVCGSQGLPEP